MVQSIPPSVTSQPPDASSVRNLGQPDTFVDLLDEKFRLRNQRLIGKLRSWGELLDIAGWCVALEWGGDDFWLSMRAQLDLRQLEQPLLTWNGLLEVTNQLVPQKLNRKSDGVLIWLPRVTDVLESTLTFGLLTHRESAVLSWLKQGKTSFEIAIILGCAPRTVDKHLANLYRKMGVNSRASLILSQAERPT